MPNNPFNPIAAKTRLRVNGTLGFMKERKTLEEILQSTSDVLFPAEPGEMRVEVNSQDVNGDTPLHVMVWRSDLYGVKVLIESGAKIDAVGDMGSTPLHVALMKQNQEIAETLLLAGASPDIRSEFGDTPRELAVSQGGTMEQLFNRHARQSDQPDRREDAAPG